MDSFSLKKALNHFNINEDEFMQIYNKYIYHQITIEEHYARERIMPEIEKWLSEHEQNRIIMKLGVYGDINVWNDYGEEICYSPDLDYDWGEKLVYLEEHEVKFENVIKVVFEDHRGNEVKQLNI